MVSRMRSVRMCSSASTPARLSAYENLRRPMRSRPSMNTASEADRATTVGVAPVALVDDRCSGSDAVSSVVPVLVWSLCRMVCSRMGSSSSGDIA